MRFRSMVVYCFALGILTASRSEGGTFTTTVQATLPNTQDDYIVQDNATEKDGAKPELRIKASGGTKNRNVVANINLPSLSGKTVLQASLKLVMFGASSSTPIQTRIYPLTQTWNELDVCWRDRTTGLPWTTGGGTAGPYWSDAVALSDQDNGSRVSWQVGPIVNSWLLGDLTNSGFVIKPDAEGSDRELVFRSSEYTNVLTDTPQLTITYTDEPPAVRSGYAEIQPTAVRVGATNTPLTLWLDVNASGTTPSGAATGFDLVSAIHDGALNVTSVDRVLVGGVPIDPSQISWYDNGASFTLIVPTIRAQARVQIDIRANVLASATNYPLQIPIFVDDTSTPGASAQVLWPGNADGTSGNGDSWSLAVTALSPTKIDLRPDSLSVVNRTCSQLQLFGKDNLGNQFTVDADSFKVLPATLGSMSPTATFCGTSAGSGKIVAFYKTLRDTTRLTVTPALTPSVSSVVLRNARGSATQTLAPADTMFLDLSLSDGNGFKDITGLDIAFSYEGHANDTAAPAYHASYRFRRGINPAWALTDPVASSWGLLSGLCVLDTTTNTTGTQSVRLAFKPGRVARASSAGQWSAGIRVYSATPADTTVATKGSLDAAVKLSITTPDTTAAFNSGRVSATLLPLRLPTSGKLTLAVSGNAPYDLKASVTDLAGTTSPTDTMHVGGSQKRIHWSVTSSPGAALLDTAWTALESAIPAAVDETTAGRDLYLWLDHPASLPPQDYRGRIKLRLDPSGIAGASANASLPTDATIVGAGQAADSAIAEVLPHSMTVAVTQTITAYLLPYFRSGDTGLDRVQVNIPQGYGIPSVTSVRVDGLPVSFTDLSRDGLAEVLLASPVQSNVLIEVRLSLSAPTAASASGSDFVLFYDDAGTPLPPQSATQGNANGLADGNTWHVSVEPGPVARLAVSPATAMCFMDTTLVFTATGSDAYGNPVTPTCSWSTAGGIGTIGASDGHFVPTATGQGIVIAASNGVADTAEVTVRPARGIAVLRVQGPLTLYQGQEGASYRVHLENLGADSVAIDSVSLHFRRSAPRDADGDFTVTIAPGNPVGIPGSARASFLFDVATHPTAATGSVTLDADASVREVSSQDLFADVGADTTQPVTVTLGGFDLSATQSSGTVSPGASDVPLLTLTFVSHYPDTRALHGLLLTNRTSGAGTQEQLGAELGELTLFRDDGDGILNPSLDTPLLSTVALDGGVNFTPLASGIAGGASVTFFVAANLPLDARDGDALDLALLDPGAVSFAPSSFTRNAWPLDPAGFRPIDGMVAAQVGIAPVGPGSLPAGARQLALDVTVPANGYEEDQLLRFAVRNEGTADPTNDIAQVEAWVDDGDGSFDPSLDRSLGTLIFTGDRWQRTGLSETIPVGGLRMFVTVTTSELAAEGATIQLSLPAAPDDALGMESGDSGPLDASVLNPYALVVSTANRITVTPELLSPRSVHPGAKGVSLLSALLTNRYSAVKTFAELAVADMTTGPGSPTERDAEIQTLSLRVDGNGNGLLDDLATDPALAVGYFDQGVARFSGFQLALAAGATQHIFVAGDVSPHVATDGDVLSAAVEGPGELRFTEPVSITGSWPLSSNASATVDGFTADAAQVRAAGSSLGPSEGNALALDVTIPSNGYLTDELNGIHVVNLGSAGPGDIGALRLWADGGDGVFSAGAGDDADLGPLTPAGAEWIGGSLAQPVTGAGSRLFVSVTASPDPADSSTVRLAIPLGGVENASDNDGPLDRAIVDPEVVTISTSPLLTDLDVAPASSAVGQNVLVRMIARNAGTERILGVTPSALAINGSASMTLVSGPVPSSVDLSPAQRDTFTWTYRSASVGDVQFRGSASGIGETSGVVRRAVEVASGTHDVLGAVGTAAVDVIQSMPGVVSRGQTDVVPFSLTFLHGGDAGASDLLLETIRIRLESSTGAGIIPSELLRAVRVAEGTQVYLSKTVLETTGADVILALPSPVRIAPNEPKTLSLRLDLSPSTTATDFRIVLTDSSSLVAEDATSGAPVPIHRSSGSFPIVSGAARLVANATELDLALVPGTAAHVGTGAVDVPALKVGASNAGTSGVTSDVRLATLGVTVCDTLGAPLPQPAMVLRGVRILAGGQAIGGHALSPGDSASFTLDLDPSPLIAAGTPLDLDVRCDIADTSPLGAFRLRLTRPQSVDARDASSGNPVAVVFTPATIQGSPVHVEARAESVLVRSDGLFPSNARVGDTGVAALRMTLRHPGGVGIARLRLDSLSIVCRDEARRALIPSTYLERLTVDWGGLRLADLAGFPGAAAPIPLPLQSPYLNPGDSVAVEIRVDFRVSAPNSFFELAIPASGLRVDDANSGTPVRIVPGAGTELPLVSGLTHLDTPPRELDVALESLLPAVLAPDGREVAAARLTLTNPSPTGVVSLDHLILIASDPRGTGLAVGRAAARAAAYVNGALWAQSAVLTSDSASAWLAGAGTLDIGPGASADVEVRVTTISPIATGSLRLGFAQGGIGVVQPSSALLAIQVRPGQGSSFPLWTKPGSFAPLSLKESYSNFPNPFAAGRQETAFAFYLPRDARITLKVWTPDGRRVATLADGAARPAGIVQVDRWNGRNGVGDLVRNGVYVAELIARYGDGTSERALRNVAVVR